MHSCVHIAGKGAKSHGYFRLRVYSIKCENKHKYNRVVYICSETTSILTILFHKLCALFIVVQIRTLKLFIGQKLLKIEDFGRVDQQIGGACFTTYAQVPFHPFKLN